VFEETGLRLTDLHFVWATNTVFDDINHVVSIFVRGALLTVRLCRNPGATCLPVR
jgi:8-oxo-dGTP pyrophosphatase MutT (NUDIX family)